MPSVRDIARQVGVSPATVSRALTRRANVTPGLRRKILGAVNRSGYVPKVGLRSTNNIGLVYTAESSLDSPFDATLIQCLHEGLDDRDLNLMILSLGGKAKEADEDYSNLFMRKGIRGVVVRTTDKARQVCRQIAAEGFPSVVVGDRFDDPAVNFVYCESRQSSRDAVRHLIELGHRRIALAVNIVDDSDHTDRTAGYRLALQSAGIDADERLILRVIARREGGAQLIRRIVNMPRRPTAVYVADPMTAVGAMCEAQEMGLRIPSDLSIVGFDDADLRFFVYPHMTAVCQDAKSLGREALAALQQLMRRPREKALTRLVLPTVLEVHGSTASPG
jgi:DNA-binding LacI/PurR family transcriptional regulator